MINIRKAKIEDAKELLDIYAPYVLNTAISFEYEVPSISEFENRIRTIKAKYPYLVAEIDGKIVGYAYATTFKGRSAYDYCVELTIYIKEGYTKQGIGRILYSKLEEVLTYQGFTNLYACIAVPADFTDSTVNRNSEEFHAHLGYKTIGTFTKCGMKFNKWYSMIWMEKMVNSHDGTPKPLKPINEIEI